MNISQDTLIYLTFSAVIPFLAISNASIFGSYSIIAWILIMLTGGVLLLMAFADYLIFTLVTSLFGITFQPSRNYLINSPQDSVTKYVNGIYYATGFITCNLFAYVFKAERIQEGEDARQAQAPDVWERAVMSIPFPFKFNVISCSRDVQQVRDELEGKRSYQEFELSKAYQSKNTNEVIITDILRKISVIQAQIDRISQDEQPVATMMYMETTAVGVTDAAAQDTLTAQLKQLQLAFGSFDLQTTRIVGRELYHLFNFNFSLPTTYSAVTSLFDKEG
jgi:hypothetical protein